VSVLSDVAICNLAVSHVGRTAAPMAALTEKSTEARLCNTWYDKSRRDVLEAQDWSFARGRLTLATHSDLPPDEWAYRYQTPADMLIPRRIWNPYADVQQQVSTYYQLGDLDNAVPYELEASLDGQTLTLLTNLSPAILIYTRDQTLVQMFPSMFVTALSHYLAAKIAFGITGNMNVAKDQEQKFQAAMAAAAAADANKGVRGPVRDGYAVRARN
jgi:hypothetical protein